MGLPMPSLISLSLLVGLAAVFALLAIQSSRKCANTLREMRDIVSSLRSMRGKVEAHDSELDAVTDALHQLRGKFYAERRKNSQTTSSSDSPEEVTGAGTGRVRRSIDGAESKDDLRRRAGLIAGKPAPHQ